MQDICQLLERRLNFQQCVLRSEPSDYGLNEYRVLKTKKIVKKGTCIDIDFKNDLF